MRLIVTEVTQNKPMFPTLFISHGSPALCMMEHQTADFIKNLPLMFDKPEYIIIVSAHWVTPELKILSNANPKLIYDFYGFPQALYNKTYAAKNDTDMVDNIINVLQKNGMQITKDAQREGYDHGVWSPLSLIYEKADIPIIQLSLPLELGINELLKIGKALQVFRKNSLIIGTGSMTHNLQDSVWQIDAPVQHYAKNFRDWMARKLETGEIDSLKKFIQLAPDTAKNHPTLEHILPLFVSIGASKNNVGQSLNDTYMYGNQSMDTIIFKE
jgi:4,5-DOPA dioxygenase extradiol